ncbi:MAG: pseudaminic acid cytidylyltransferase [Lachnospiraceae bacterium]|nr:pseudaminic acid cytidylyltransferase [Lachnospiraceae bacterium]
MKNLAVITARGGSKRIPRKNIREFLGQPIITYSIRAALESGIFDTVMVSTEDAQIAETAKAAGAEVPFLRSAVNADDHSTTADVLLEVLLEYEKRGEHFDAVCCIYPTAPFITKDALRSAMQTLSDREADTVMPVVQFSFPPRRALLLRNGELTPHYPEDQLKRSQDLEPEYHDCGQFYCLRVSSFLREKRVVMTHTAAFLQDEMAVQDIDTEKDWEIAELKYRLLHQEERV